MAEDLDRRYYVYLHADKATGVPFYVGKGKGGRAYETEGRNDYWHAKVASLPKGYTVEMAGENLTELEAFELERDLVQQHGKARDGSGTLVNLEDGGEFPFSIGIKLPDVLSDILRADFESRHYRQPGPEEEGELLERLHKRIEEFDNHPDGELGNVSDVYEVDTDLQMAFEQAVWQVKRAIRFRRRRAMSWKEFAYQLDGAQEEIESVDDTANERPSLVNLSQRLHQFLSEEVSKLRMP